MLLPFSYYDLKSRSFWYNCWHIQFLSAKTSFPFYIQANAFVMHNCWLSTTVLLKLHQLLNFFGPCCTAFLPKLCLSIGISLVVHKLSTMVVTGPFIPSGLQFPISQKHPPGLLIIMDSCSQSTMYAPADSFKSSLFNVHSLTKRHYWFLNSSKTKILQMTCPI